MVKTIDFVMSSLDGEYLADCEHLVNTFCVDPDEYMCSLHFPDNTYLNGETYFFDPLHLICGHKKAMLVYFLSDNNMFDEEAVNQIATVQWPTVFLVGRENYCQYDISQPFAVCKRHDRAYSECTWYFNKDERESAVSFMRYWESSVWRTM